jgi:hypothetical protein
MKRSRSRGVSVPSSLDAVMRFVDDEIAKIVAEVGAHRPPAPVRKPRPPRAKTTPAPVHAA